MGIILLDVIITYIVIPLMKERTTKEYRENLMFWVRIVVQSAEQILNERSQGIINDKYFYLYFK